MHRSQETMARLIRSIEMQKLLIEDVDKEDFMRTDFEFHNTIMATTKVKRLPATVRMVSQHVDRARLLRIAEPGRLSETVSEHIEIVEAIRQKNVTGAEEAMRRHVRQLYKRLEPLEAARPDLFST